MIITLMLGVVGAIGLKMASSSLVAREKNTSRAQEREIALSANNSALAVVAFLFEEPVEPGGPDYPDNPFFTVTNYFSATPSLGNAHTLYVKGPPASGDGQWTQWLPSGWSFDAATSTFTMLTPNPGGPGIQNGANFDAIFAAASTGGSTSALRADSGANAIKTTVTLEKAVYGNGTFIDSLDFQATTTVTGTAGKYTETTKANVPLPDPPQPSCSLTATDNTSGATLTSGSVYNGTNFTISVKVTGLVDTAELFTQASCPSPSVANGTNKLLGNICVLKSGGTAADSIASTAYPMTIASQPFTFAPDPGVNTMTIHGAVLGPMQHLVTCPPFQLVSPTSVNPKPSPNCPYTDAAKQPWGPLTVQYQDANTKHYANQPAAATINTIDFTKLPTTPASCAAWDPLCSVDNETPAANTCTDNNGNPVNCNLAIANGYPGGFWYLHSYKAQIVAMGEIWPLCPGAASTDYCFTYYPPPPVAPKNPKKSGDWTPNGALWVHRAIDPHLVVGFINVAGGKDCTLYTFGRYNGCFAPETPIRMADGSEKPAKFVNGGEWLWNPIRKQPVRVKRLVMGPEAKPLYELGYEGHLVRVTENHPFPTPSGLRPAKELTVGQVVLDAEGKHHRIMRFVKLPRIENQMVWNFELESKNGKGEDHYLVANGIISGDVTLQEQLEKREKKSGSPNALAMQKTSP